MRTAMKSYRASPSKCTAQTQTAVRPAARVLNLFGWCYNRPFGLLSRTGVGHNQGRTPPMSLKSIRVKGAREHNLRDVNVDIPRDQLVVITGLSGSGKSTLAFDTIYAEGQRKYVESLSAYARQFLEQLQKPDVDEIEGLPPTIAIEQRSASSNPRSIVATTTEIYDYLRVLFARVGMPHCWECGRRISSQSPSQIVDAVMGNASGAKLMILAPLIRGQKGEHKDVFGAIHKQGFVRARV